MHSSFPSSSSLPMRFVSTAPVASLLILFCTQVNTARLGLNSADAIMDEETEHAGESSRHNLDLVAVLFFVTYFLLVSVVIMNVVVAVLIDAFSKAISEDEEEARRESEIAERQKLAGPLDPLLATLANFTTLSHLRLQIELLFAMLDSNHDDLISFQEMRYGFESLEIYNPPIRISVEDWDEITNKQKFCDDAGRLCGEQFALAILRQLRLYAQRLVAHRMCRSIQHASDDTPILFAFKLAFAQQTIDFSGLANRSQPDDEEGMPERSRKKTTTFGSRGRHHYSEETLAILEATDRVANLAQEARDVAQEARDAAHATHARVIELEQVMLQGKGSIPNLQQLLYSPRGSTSAGPASGADHRGYGLLPCKHQQAMPCITLHMFPSPNSSQ